MGDNDEVMRFEITDQDLEDEINPSYGKPRMSKNQVRFFVTLGRQFIDCMASTISRLIMLTFLGHIRSVGRQ